MIGGRLRTGELLAILEPYQDEWLASERRARLWAEEVTTPAPLREWLHKQRTGMPHVTWKFAASVDGRSAAADGTSRWITGPEARAEVGRERAAHGAVLTGTGTALTDDPHLTARAADGSLLPHQPLRVVMGERPLPDGALRLIDPPG